MDKYIVYGLDFRQEITIFAENFEINYESDSLLFVDRQRNVIAFFSISSIRGFINVSTIEQEVDQ